MQHRGTIIALVLAFVAGFAISQWEPWSDSQDSAITAPEPEEGASLALPVAARKLWFAPMEAYEGETLADEDFDALLATLQERMEAGETLADFGREAPLYLHGFVRRVAMPELTPEQSERTYAYLEELSERRPEHKQMIGQYREMLEREYAQANEYAMPFSIAAHGWFPDTAYPDPRGGPFDDEGVARLLEMLDLLLTMPETAANFEQEADLYLWQFGNNLQEGSLTDDQTARVIAYFDEVKARHPESAEIIDRNSFLVQNLTPGQTAPNIVGRDLDGVEFELAEYRGNIVVIYFSGHWCGPCRTEYPYKRFMLELYKDDPVVILGVNSDEDMETILEAKEDEGLDYRVWWDGHGEVATEGPIATEWNVTGWPSIYILDEKGVIRFAQKQHADVITSVNELLWSLESRQWEQDADTEA